MAAHPKVSIIIPVYGVEKFIEQCARSLFEQTLDDLEYIFVDDCSPDNSIGVLKEIIEEYPHRKSQIKIVRMNINSGQAAVRRYGISLATGEYIIHCDSDDWVEKDMYNKLYSVAVNKDADVVVCDFSVDNGNKSRIFEQNCPCDKLSAIKSLLRGAVHGALWNKLVKRSLYSKMLYPTGNLCEDLCMNLQFMFYANKICYISYPGYHYRVNSCSITRQITSEKIHNRLSQFLPNYKLITDFLTNHNLLIHCKYELCHLKLNTRLDLCKIAKGDGYRIWLNVFPELGIKDVILSSLDVKSKVKLILTFLRFYPF